MRPTTRNGKSQQGVAAVEFAMLSVLLVMLLTVPLFFSRVFWHYTTMQKAAHDAAWYLATVPSHDMKNYSKALDAVSIAKFIAESEVAELNPGGEYPVAPTVECRPLPCGIGSPSTVAVRVGTLMYDPIFHVSYAGADGFPVLAISEMNYVGP
ncbi:pilus assembly protein [Massilia agilis]|uniref:Pilus assembly protein n=1 Tax=Massilia agilis TaxID=1811226 RepID=A0ABT2DCS4_9BURK|nr:TadE/TadG family type IV pilus assembly protein [Massilia agilis]MCS0809128.1 pilus assembly protein [Massilia agilis]